MKTVGRHSFKTPHRCHACRCIIDACDVVMTLPGNRDNPAEYALACPECRRVEPGFDELPEEEAAEYEAAIQRWSDELARK